MSFICSDLYCYFRVYASKALVSLVRSQVDDALAEELSLPTSTIEMDFEANFDLRAAEQDQRDDLQAQLQEAVQEAHESRDCLCLAEDNTSALQLELDDVTAKPRETCQQLRDALDEGDKAEAKAEHLEQTTNSKTDQLRPTSPTWRKK